MGGFWRQIDLLIMLGTILKKIEARFSKEFLASHYVIYSALNSGGVGSHSSVATAGSSLSFDSSRISSVRDTH